MTSLLWCNNRNLYAYHGILKVWGKIICLWSISLKTCHPQYYSLKELHRRLKTVFTFHNSGLMIRMVQQLYCFKSAGSKEPNQLKFCNCTAFDPSLVMNTFANFIDFWTYEYMLPMFSSVIQSQYSFGFSFADSTNKYAFVHHWRRPCPSLTHKIYDTIQGISSAWNYV